MYDLGVSRLDVFFEKLQSFVNKTPTSRAKREEFTANLPVPSILHSPHVFFTPGIEEDSLKPHQFFNRKKTNEINKQTKNSI